MSVDPSSPAPGRLYGVGVGPGDPELMTLKAARLIAAAPVVAYFCKRGRRGHGRTIIEGLVRQDAVEEALVYPMTVEVPACDPAYEDALTAFYDTAAARLAGHLADGRDVVVVSEGDPFLYGSFMPLFHRLSGRFETEVVAGVAAMAGCWSAAGTPVAGGDDVLTVLPATLAGDVLARHLGEADAAVIMKLGRHLPKVKGILEELGLAERAVYVEHGTMAGERVMPLAQRDQAEAPYFSLILVPGRGRRL